MEGNRRKEDILSVEKFGEYKTEVKESTESLERPALKKKVEGEEHLEIYGSLREEIENENVFVRPNGLPENVETAVSCRGPGPARKNIKRYTS